MTASTLLTEAHTQMLHDSAIAPKIIATRGYRSIHAGAVQAVKELAGGAYSDKILRTILHAGALAFPVYQLGDATPYAWVLRPDLPRTNADGKPIKYEWPRLKPSVFDVLPSYSTALADPAIPIWITEGAKKVDALASAYGDAIVPMNINGVWNWRGTNTSGGKVALADFELVAWEGRTVVLAFDSDSKFNKQVQAALQRLARLLQGRWKVADVQVLDLPQRASDPKTGIDDYLAHGHTLDDLTALLRPIATASLTARVAFGTHPETHAKLMLPSGYDVQHQSIVQLDANGTPRKVYSGAICVTEVGENLHTREKTATVSWNGRGDHHRDISIPYAALSDSRQFSALVGAAGAAIGPKNIKDVQQFLVEFAQENIDALPHRAHADRLGYVQGGCITPAGAVGFGEDVRYVGTPKVSIGTDADAYPAALRAALAWDAWPLWLAVGLSLAGPALARLRPRRNPVVYFAGASGSGKTTVTQFATGCWGDPARAPFRIEAARTTPAGIFQTVEGLGGLPTLIDEAHTVPEPKKLENACYGFANGQRYTVGSAEGKAKGGDTLHGTLLLAGEATPDWKHAGARLRVLWVDVATHLPLGAEPRSIEGEARAKQLEQAWETGAGLFGLSVAESIWADWPGFVARVRKFEQNTALAPLQAWRTPLAVAATVLFDAFRVANITELPPSFADMLHQWAAMLTSGHDDVDPATEAWEALVTMLAQGRQADDSEGVESDDRVPARWEWIEADRGGGQIACRKVGDDYWRVISTAQQFKERVGTSAVQLYGPTWIKRGWVRPDPTGKATTAMRLRNRELLRVLVVPMSAIEEWSAPGLVTP